MNLLKYNRCALKFVRHFLRYLCRYLRHNRKCGSYSSKHHFAEIGILLISKIALFSEGNPANRHFNLTAQPWDCTPTCSML